MIHTHVSPFPSVCVLLTFPCARVEVQAHADRRVALLRRGQVECHVRGHLARRYLHHAVVWDPPRGVVLVSNVYLFVCEY